MPFSPERFLPVRFFPVCPAPVLRICLCLATLLCAAEAHADDLSTSADEKADPPGYLFSVRPTFGLGGGNLGIGARLGLSAEFWLTRFIGVGFEGGASGQARLFGPESSARYLGPTVALRSSPRGGTFFATFGVGYASVHRTDGHVCWGDPCPPPPSTGSAGEGDTHTINLAAGWLGHPGGSFFEIGPVVRLQTLGGFQGGEEDYLLTVNLELGFALLGGAERP